MRPVVSVGNLRAGGSGKTPVVAHLARLLLGQGERPAILTRGYRRRRAPEGVTIVSDGARVLANFETAGDEALMLALALPGVPVLVGANRFESGRLAEQRFGVTVHVLDDGFQHLALARDADLLLVDQSDLRERVMPMGLLREPTANAEVADALLVTAGPPGEVARISTALGVPTAFSVTRTIGAPHALSGAALDLSSDVALEARAFAFAGIARADRFFTDLSNAGWRLAGTAAFRDHHAYSQRDIDRIVAQARAAGAVLLLTTEKDAVRLHALNTAGCALGVVPLSAMVESSAVFTEWLMRRIRARRP